MEQDAIVNSILSFLRSDVTRLGTVSTVSDEKPHAAVVYYAFDDRLSIYFVTRMESRKYKSILKNPRVAFSVATEKPPKTLQLEGTASLVSDPTEQRDLFPSLVSLATERNALPPMSQTYGTSEVAFMKITPIWARLGDFTVPSAGNLFQEIAF